MLNVGKIPLGSPIALPSTPVDLRRLIIKLRWIGMEAEALTLHRVLDHIAPGECAALWPIDTD